jgi:hypothetical protein
MSTPSRLLTRAFSVGVLVVSTSYGASALTVTRCNMLSDGVYRPVLVIESGGSTTVHPMGEDGLTRSILFNPAAALAWAKERYGADASVVSQSLSCGETGGGGIALVVSVPGDDDDDDDDDELPDDDDDDDDDDGGCTFCG